MSVKNSTTTSDYIEWDKAVNLVHRLYNDGDYRLSFLPGPYRQFFAAKDQQPLWRISDQRDIAGIPWASAFACSRGRNQK